MNEEERLEFETETMKLRTIIKQQRKKMGILFAVLVFETLGILLLLMLVL
jgi:hypothetical protein